MWRPQRRLGDAAHGAVLTMEAIIVAVFLVSVVVFLQSTTDRLGTSDSDGAWDRVKHMTDTWLHVAYGLHSTNLSHYTNDPTRGANLLERFLHDRYNHAPDGEHNFRKLTQMYYPAPGIVVELDQRIATDAVTLFETHKGDPRGENVALSKYIAPTMNSIHIAPLIEPLDGTTPFIANALFLNHSQTVRQPGDTLRMTVERQGLTTNLGANTNVTVHTAVTQRNTNTAAVSVTWDRAADNAMFGLNDLTFLSPPESETFADFEVIVRATSHAAPVTTRAKMVMTEGFKEHQPLTFDGWVGDGVNTLPDGTVQMHWKRNLPLTADTDYKLQFRAKRDETVAPDYTFVHLTLSDGAMARSTAALRHAYNPAEKTRPASLHPTAPYEIAQGTLARFSAVYVNGPDPATLTAFTIDLPGEYDLHHHDGNGARLFDTSRPIEAVLPANQSPVKPCAFTGSQWTFVDTTTVAWCGRASLLPYEPFTFRVDVPIKRAETTQPTRPNNHGELTSYMSKLTGYFTANLTFQNNAHVAASIDGGGAWRDQPTLLRFRVPPQTASTPGYPTLTHGNGATGPNNHVNATLHWNTAPFTTPHPPSTFSLQPAVPSITTLQAAVLNSTITPNKRVMNAGDTATVTINHNALFQELEGLGALVTNVKHRAEYYTPINHPNQPFLVIEDDIDVATASPVTTLITHDSVTGGDHEIHVTTKSGHAVVFTTQAGGTPPAPPVWSTNVTPHHTDETVHHATLDANPLLSGHETLTATTRGLVTLLDAATGARYWQTDLGALVKSAAADHRPKSNLGLPQGRVYTAHAATTGATTVTALDPATGNTLATLTADPSTTQHLLPFAHATAPDARAVLLVTDNGQLTALTKDLTQLWTATLPGSPGAFLHANASDFDQNPGNGEELLVVHENTVTLVASTGATVTTWTPPTPLRLATTANATYGAAPELAVAHTNHALTVLTLDSPPAQFSATNTFAATNLNAPGTTKRALDTPDPAQATCLMVDPPVTVTPIDLDHKLCTNPLNNDPPGNTLQRTQLALTRDPTSNHNPVLAVASHANDLLFLEAFDLTTGLHKWGPLESNNPADQQASALAWTPSRDVTQQPATPYLAVGTQGGRLFLLNYADGTSAWTNPVTAKAGQGPITVHLQIPRATLPGTHVIKSTLQWDQAIAAGKLTQKAHLLTYIEVAEANREFVAGNYWIAMDLRAWMMDWDH